jgi:hypothetical protein
VLFARLQVEVVGAPVLGAIIRAQDAASLGQCGALMQELRSVHSALLAMTASIERMHERCLPTVCVARAHSHARPRSRLSRSLGIVQVQQASCERIRIRASQPAAATARALLFPARHDVGSSIDGPVPRACMLQHSATLSPNQRAPCNRGLWPRRAAQVFYERIRPFLAGSRGSELLPQGVIFQGVGPAGATPHKLHGGSAAGWRHKAAARRNLWRACNTERFAGPQRKLTRWALRAELRFRLLHVDCCKVCTP